MKLIIKGMKPSLELAFHEWLCVSGGLDNGSEASFLDYVPRGKGGVKYLGC